MWYQWSDSQLDIIPQGKTLRASAKGTNTTAYLFWILVHYSPRVCPKRSPSHRKQAGVEEGLEMNCKELIWKLSQGQKCAKCPTKQDIGPFNYLPFLKSFLPQPHCEILWNFLVCKRDPRINPSLHDITDTMSCIKIQVSVVVICILGCH